MINGLALVIGSVHANISQALLELPNQLPSARLMCICLVDCFISQPGGSLHELHLALFLLPSVLSYNSLTTALRRFLSDAFSCCKSLRSRSMAVVSLSVVSKNSMLGGCALFLSIIS